MLLKPNELLIGLLLSDCMIFWNNAKLVERLMMHLAELNVKCKSYYMTISLNEGSRFS